ncbi:MAG TPA: tyrosine-type recombinase/integrase [Propionibacteriaceae bacterium]
MVLDGEGPGNAPVEAVGVVRQVDRQPGFVLLDADGGEFGPATDWLLQLVANGSSPHTVRAYAMSLLRFLRYTWFVGCPWGEVNDRVARDFVLWAKQADKFTGAKNPASHRLAVNRVTGKRVQTARYAASTINHTLSVVHEFYEFFREQGQGPLRNPVPSAGRADRHHNPADPFSPRRRGSLRQKEPQRLPRAIPDDAFDDLFRKLKSNRDRALVAFYVTSGARASELLGLTGDMVNYGDQLIGVVRKGGARQWLPASPDAFVWLRLYQLDRGAPGDGQPVWLTLREPHRPLTYDALRAVMGRVNELLGSNWTMHDLRHTFTIRALDGGMPMHEVQEILGHASLATMAVYSKPRLEEVVAHHRAVFDRAYADVAESGQVDYDTDALATVFGRAR